MRRRESCGYRVNLHSMPRRHRTWIGASKSAADPKAGGVHVASSDDVSVGTRFVGVGGDGFVGFEVQIALDRDLAQIKMKAMAALQVIEKAINDHPTTGGAKRLVRFLAGLYNGQDYPFDLTELRGLDTNLANACLDYLNYDRLGIKEVHKHLANGDRDLHRWLEEYKIEPASRS